MTSASDIEQKAAEWLIRQDAGLSSTAMAELENWLKSNHRHRATFLRLQEAWHRTDVLQRVRPLDGSVDQDLLRESPFVRVVEHPARVTTKDSGPDELDTRDAPGADRMQPAAEAANSAFDDREPNHAIRSFAIAAALLIALVGGLWYQFRVPHWRHYSTDLGGFERVVLSDDSTVHLNTNSSIRVLMTKDHRQIVLERGEALFKVAHDRNRPFDVDAAGTTVRAVGTEFSVRLHEKGESAGGQQNVEVFVREGKVSIDAAAHALQQTRALEVPAVPTLRAGETVTVSAKRMYIAKVSDDDVPHKLAWVEGRLWFERQRLADVVAEFNRYNRAQMVIVDASIADMRIGGGFDATDPESFTAALERTLPVHVDRSDPLLVRLSAAREAVEDSGDAVPEQGPVPYEDSK